ncbi:acyltransferase [Flavobacterium sp. ANB]|uniref:acyltransferase family protein n=1 Tax=unclassified Flavobacterium TaxID=196869 RepID=UPI0012B8EED4|nr:MULTISPECIES: acyltransferase [unclassified Flavobacterium]MBF4515636.1 acyltransferase [Flavobacterium sp. ANB]MTD68639.1 acyltransferase family protein [Flavobacterium sp. LC2016-13]
MSSQNVALSQNAEQPNKLVYINNIKVLLTILVILHHTFIAYSGSGWYYTEPTTIMGVLIPMKMFISINQAFFMGFFFMLAAYFTDASFTKKGTFKFITDRLIRLGIPLVVYALLISPFTSYLVYYFALEHHITFLQYMSGYDTWEVGVMWFVLALLVFTFIYVIVKTVFKINFENTLPVPGSRTIILFAIALGLVTFLVRIIFPVGWVLEPFGFQLGHFPQYIAFFIIGLLASKNNWFEALSEKTRKRLTLSSWLCLLFFPVFFVIRITLKMPVEWYAGGFHWQQLLYAVWEQWIGLSILTVLLIKGRKNWNKSSVLLNKLTRYSFVTYIFHPVVIVGFTLAVRNWAVDPAIKLLVVSPLIVAGSFALGGLVLLIPGVKKIL